MLLRRLCHLLSLGKKGIKCNEIGLCEVSFFFNLTSLWVAAYGTCAHKGRPGFTKWMKYLMGIDFPSLRQRLTDTFFSCLCDGDVNHTCRPCGLKANNECELVLVFQARILPWGGKVMRECISCREERKLLTHGVICGYTAAKLIWCLSG